MSKTIGVTTFKEAVLELWRSFGLPMDLEVECFHMANRYATKVRVASAYFKTVEDYVDEAWERFK